METPSTPRRWKVTAVWLVIAVILAIAAGIVGISDNPPGILLAYGSAAALVLAFVHPWRTSRQFRYFFYIAFAGFAVLVVVHNVLEAVAGRMAGPGFIVAVLQGIQVAAFLIAILVCPPALVIGAVGAVAMGVCAHRRRKPVQDAGA